MTKYYIKYTIDKGEFNVDENTEIDGNTGYCHSIVIHSVLLPEDGSYSGLTYGFNGKKKRPISDYEKFKCLMSIANELQDSEEINEFQKELCQMINQSIFDYVKRRRNYGA